MKIVLHEIELHSVNPEASKSFYSDIIGLPANIDIEGLKCYDAGWPGVEVNKSTHYSGRTSISFLVDDIQEFVESARNAGYDIDDPTPSHLEMIATHLIDPDGIRIEIQQPTDSSPEWLKAMLR
jgi:predicted enzyme related to lactoylglutathione lyase